MIVFKKIRTIIITCVLLVFPVKRKNRETVRKKVRKIDGRVDNSGSRVARPVISLSVSRGKIVPPLGFRFYRSADRNHSVLEERCAFNK